MSTWNALSLPKKILVVFGVLVLIGIVTNSGNRPSSSSSPTPPAQTSTTVAAATVAGTAAPTATPVRTTAAPTPTPAPTPFNFGSGKKLVPSEVPPGTYRMRTASAGCYWERLSGLGGTTSEILANDNAAGPAVVTVLATDVAFNSVRCAPWSVDLSPITTSPTAPFGAGTFIVGTDIAAGTWRSSGATSCYWQRQSGFTGSSREIIANDNSGDTIVAIGANDKGFTSTRCGTWTKVS